jgi:hypothetical protein
MPPVDGHGDMTGCILFLGVGGALLLLAALARRFAVTSIWSGVSADHSAVDVMFATMMIPHHKGFIEMSDMGSPRRPPRSSRTWPPGSRPPKARRSSRCRAG